MKIMKKIVELLKGI